jgi:hypothetical protein
LVEQSKISKTHTTETFGHQHHIPSNLVHLFLPRFFSPPEVSD